MVGIEMTISVCLQSKMMANPSALPPGFDNNAISISGHWFLWGKAHTAIEVLTASDQAIEDKLAAGPWDDMSMPAGTSILLDLEAPIRMQQYMTLPHYVRHAIAEAIARRLHVARDYFGDTFNFGVYVPGYSAQDRPNYRDYATVAGIMSVAEHDAFIDCDFLWQRCYPFCHKTNRRWWKHEHVIKNGFRMGEAVSYAARKQLRVICGLSWEVFGDRTKDDADQPLISASDLRELIDFAPWYNAVHVWSGPEQLHGKTVTELASDLAGA